MDETQNKDLFHEERAMKEKLEALKCQVANLHAELPCLRQCSRLSHLLVKLYEIREGVNRLEQGLIQTHLKCCISPNIKVPGEVVVAVSKLSEKHHGAIIVIEQKDNLETHIKGGVEIEAPVNPAILENIFYPE